MWTRFLEALAMRATGRYAERMIDRAIQGLRRLMAPLVLRRALVVICALAFVTVTVAHGAQCLHGPIHAATTLSDALPSGDGPDFDMAPPADHCSACTIAIPAGSAAALREPPHATDRVVPPRQDPRPFIPAAEIRPPIALI